MEFFHEVDTEIKLTLIRKLMEANIDLYDRNVINVILDLDLGLSFSETITCAVFRQYNILRFIPLGLLMIINPKLLISPKMLMGRECECKRMPKISEWSDYFTDAPPCNLCRSRNFLHKPFIVRHYYNRIKFIEYLLNDYFTAACTFGDLRMVQIIDSCWDKLNLSNAYAHAVEHKHITEYMLSATTARLKPQYEILQVIIRKQKNHVFDYDVDHMNAGIFGALGAIAIGLILEIVMFTRK